MSFVKRLTQIITPPIWRRESPPTIGTEDHALPTAGPRVSEVKEILECLLDPGDRTEDLTRQMLERLREIAKKYGRMNTAREVRDCVLRMTETNAVGRPYKKGRGYELAADLIFQHVQQQLRGLETTEGVEHIKELPALVHEILDCLVLAIRYVKGVELCLDISDQLIQGVLIRRSAGHHLRIAEQILAETLEKCLSEQEHQEQAKRVVKSAGTDEEIEHGHRDSALLAYLSRKKTSVHKVSAILMNAPYPGSRDAVGSASAAELGTHLESFVSVSKTAGETRDYVLASYCTEQAAIVLRRAGRTDAKSYAAQAVLMYEKAAATEREVGLRTRAARHHSSAARIRENFELPLKHA